MIAIRLEGVDEASESVLAVAEKMGIGKALEAVAERFEDRLRAATPVGYSGNLPSSVMSLPEDDKITVGYEKGVEKAGPKSVLRPEPPTRRSVLFSSQSKRKRWITAGELEVIMEDTAGPFSAEVLEMMSKGTRDVGVS